MKEPNTVTVQFMTFSHRGLVPRKKAYTFHIPKKARYKIPLNAKYAILYLVNGNGAGTLELVKINKIFREDIEETGRGYKSFSGWQEVIL